MVHISNLVDPSNLHARYSFQMTLSLRSRPLGRWNKLEFNRYECIKLEDGEATALALKNERPFWFSKVRSYSSNAVG
jgi:F-box protein 9